MKRISKNAKQFISFLLIIAFIIPFLPITLAETDETPYLEVITSDNLPRRTHPGDATWADNFPISESLPPSITIEDNDWFGDFSNAEMSGLEIPAPDLSEERPRPELPNPPHIDEIEEFADNRREIDTARFSDILNPSAEEQDELITSADLPDPEDLIAAPFSFDHNQSENINLNTGGLVYENIDYVLPGINGLDLTIGRRYNSERANILTPRLGVEFIGNFPVFAVGWHLNVLMWTGSSWVEREDLFHSEFGPDSWFETAINDFHHLARADVRPCGPRCPAEHRTITGEFGARAIICEHPFIHNGIQFIEAISVTMLYLGHSRRYNAISAGVLNTYLNDKHGLGSGWSFMFSSIETNVFNEQQLHLSDGRTFNIHFTPQANDSNLRSYNLIDLRLERGAQGETFSNGSVSSHYTLFHKDGRREFFSQDGRLIGIRDRYNNTIRLVHTTQNGQPRIVITDTLNRTITISSSAVSSGARTVTVALPDSKEIRYTINHATSGNAPIVFLSGSTDTMNIQTNYGYFLNVGYFNIQEKALPGNITRGSQNAFLNLETIFHPTGAISIYEYEMVDKNLFISHSLNMDGDGLWGLQRVPRITSRRDEIGTNIFNEKQYIYSANNHSGWSTIPANRNNGPLIRRNFTYQTTVRTVLAGLEETHNFNNNHLTTSIDTRHNTRRVENRAFTYDRNYLPTRITTQTFDYQNNNTLQTAIELFQYDTRGNITASWSPLANGNTANTEHRTTFTYDARFSELTNITYKQDVNTTIQTIFTLDSTGRHPLTETTRVNNIQRNRTDRTFSAQGNILTERRFIDGGNDIANSILTTFTYDRNAYLASVTNGDVVTRFAYDTLGRLTSHTDPNGNVIRYEYNRRNDIIRIIHPDNSEVQFARNYTQNFVIETDALGTATITAFTPLGQPRAVSDGFWAGNSFIVDNPLKEMTYDSLNRLQTETNLITGSTTTLTYDHLDRITSSITRRGNTTLAQETFAYAVVPNGLQRITHTLHGDTNAPSIITTSYTNNMGFEVQTGAFLNGTEHRDTFQFDYLGNMTQSLSALDAQRNRPFTTRWEYNHLGLVTRETNTLNQSIVFTYDALGRNIGITDRSGNTTTFTYDNLDRLLTQSTPFEGTHRAVTRFTYDQAGNITREETQNNTPGSPTTWTRTDYVYNNRNFLTRVDSFNGNTLASRTSYAHDVMGNILTKRTGTSAANFATTTFTYDYWSNVRTITDPLGQIETFTHNPLGNLLTHTDRNGTIFTHTYDGLGRLINTTATASGRPTETTSTTFTLTGEIRSKTNPTGTTTFTYDALGRIITKTDPGNVAKTYTYDIGGNRLSFALRTGTTNHINATYTYDNLNRLLTVREGGTLQATYAYDINGNRASLTLANGITTTYTYNLANLVTSLTNRRGNTVLSSYTYTYQLDGNQITKTDHNGRVATYVYDGLGRLTSETETGGANPSQNETITYTFDARSNRATMTRNGVTTTYTYDRNNRLLSTTTDGVTTSFTYDRNGNQLTEGSIANTYNLFNQLTSSRNTTFTYRPDGMRHSKTTNNVTTIHLWDGSNIVADVVDGRITAYIRGIGLISARSSGNITFYLFDAHGSVVQLTDSSGEVIREYDYDAFGVERLPDFGDADGSGRIDAGDVTAMRRYIAAAHNRPVWLEENSGSSTKTQTQTQTPSLIPQTLP